MSTTERQASTADPVLPSLSREEIGRYARHLVLPDFGMEGQRRLKAARVLLVGAGGLGSPAALYLSAAGVGTLGVVDFDDVDLTNLQRQVLHGTKDVGRSKLDSAADRIRDVNPHVEVVAHPVRLTSENALDILEPYDVVVDGTDNFPTRYLVNDACVLLGKPNVYGSVFRWEGQASVFAVEGGPCYRCLFREPPPPGLVPDCAEGGVLGVLPGIIGSLQALETVKLLTGLGDPLVGRLFIFEALEGSWREVRIRRNPECPVCGDHPTQTGLIDYEAFCGTRVGEEVDLASARPAGAAASVGAGAPGGPAGGLDPEAFEVGAAELAARLEAGGSSPFLLDVREPHEWEITNLEGHGARLVPMRQVPERLDEVPRDRDVVVYCRTGARSGRVTDFLRAQGFPRTWNLAGGIHAWSDEVDPSVPKY